MRTITINVCKILFLAEFEQTSIENYIILLLVHYIVTVMCLFAWDISDDIVL